MTAAPHAGRPPIAGGNLGAARVLTEALITDATDVFMAPGSRNTPLAVAFDELATAGAARLHVLLDERAAGFAALGAARAAQRPAVLLCTSGTAAGHFLPAVMEAHASRVPLLVLTADRPPELHHCGAPQTIVQHGIYAPYTRWSATLATPDENTSDRDLRWIAAMGTRARIAATGMPAGPVHLNVPFRKPLLDAVADLPTEVRRAGGGHVRRGVLRLTPTEVDALAELLHGAGRGIIHCGPQRRALDDERLGEAMVALGARLGWPVIADGVSGARFGTESGVVHHAEALVRAGSAPLPDIMLRVGGPPTNKALAEWMATVQAGVLIDPDGLCEDPAARCREVVVAEPTLVAADLHAALPAQSGPQPWLARWQTLDEVAGVAIAGEVAGASAGLRAAWTIAKALPPGARLHVASSMAVRDFDAVARRRQRLSVTCHRGVNGIDGTLASALGIALATGERCTVLLGDLAFAHDVAGLRAATATSAAITAVVVNNGGGGIFEMLPVAGQLERSRFERLFATPQAIDIGAITRAAGAHHVLTDPSELDAVLAEPGDGVRVVEIREERSREMARRRRFWQRVESTVQAGVTS